MKYNTNDLKSGGGFTRPNFAKQNLGGFTLIELLVVTAIIAALSGVLIFNFRSASANKTARNQVSSLIISAIRRAQTMTTSSTQFAGSITCGFGVHYVNPTSYLIYAGSDGGVTCTAANKNYQDCAITTPCDSIVQTINFINPNFDIKSPFLDIFFEPPDPKTYISGNAALDGPSTTIMIGVKSKPCGGGACTNITIKTSGGIDIVEN